MSVAKGRERLALLLFAVALVVSCGQSEPGPASVDLSPGAIACSQQTVPNGGSLTVTLTLANSGSASPSTAFDVDFYFALTSTFSTATDTKIGMATVSSGPAGNSTVSVPASVTIPAGTLNQSTYIYANVDPAGTVTESDRTNNVSTVGAAAVVQVYDASLPILLETYSPDGSAAPDTIMALYKNVAGSAVYQGKVSNDGGPGGFATINAGVLTPGTYYVVVTDWNPGPYAFTVRTSAFTRSSFTHLNSNAEDLNEPDDTPQTWPVTGNPASLPAKPQSVSLGASVNRYAGASDWDWFTFTIP